MRFSKNKKINPKVSFLSRIFGRNNTLKQEILNLKQSFLYLEEDFLEKNLLSSVEKIRKQADQLNIISNTKTISQRNFTLLNNRLINIKKILKKNSIYEEFIICNLDQIYSILKQISRDRNQDEYVGEFIDDLLRDQEAESQVYNKVINEVKSKMEEALLNKDKNAYNRQNALALGYQNEYNDSLEFIKDIEASLNKLNLSERTNFRIEKLTQIMKIPGIIDFNKDKQELLKALSAQVREGSNIDSTFSESLDTAYDIRVAQEALKNAEVEENYEKIKQNSAKSKLKD
jgi:hypothetical protein